MKHFTFAKSLPLLALALLLFVVGCQRFYLPVATPAPTQDEKEKVVRENVGRQKYFIVRHASGVYSMNNIQIDQQEQRLNFQPGIIPEAHQVYTNFRRKYRYKRKLGEEVVLNEVHVYLKGNEQLNMNNPVSVPLADIEKIEVIEFDKGRTTISYVLGAVGGALGAVAVTGIIIALTKSSCPFVSIYDGETYQVQGELFGGAIYPSLERQDFVPLKANALNGEYNIRISNELLEKQYTNFAKLLVIAHDKNKRALTDQEGRIHTVAQPVGPTKAMLNDKHDVTSLVRSEDALFCAFNDTMSKNHINSLVLSFDKPAGNKQAKLLLQLKNSYWFDYLFGEFSKAFGGYYKQWVKKQKKVKGEELEKWSLEQHIPLHISLKTDTGWKEVGNLKTIGPLTNREVLIPLELQGSESAVLEIKLSTGFMFWELDFAGVDYSPGEDYTLHTLDPYYAVDEKDKDVLPALMLDDNLYLDQPQPGNAAILKYKMDKEIAHNQATSVILHTKGYYEHVRDYSGKPNLAFLKGFRQPGAFAAFSRQQYEKVRTQNVFAANN